MQRPFLALIYAFLKLDIKVYTCAASEGVPIQCDFDAQVALAFVAKERSAKKHLQARQRPQLSIDVTSSDLTRVSDTPVTPVSDFSPISDDDVLVNSLETSQKTMPLASESVTHEVRCSHDSSMPPNHSLYGILSRNLIILPIYPNQNAHPSFAARRRRDTMLISHDEPNGEKQRMKRLLVAPLHGSQAWRKHSKIPNQSRLRSIQMLSKLQRVPGRV